MLHALLLIPIGLIIYGWARTLPPVLGTIKPESGKLHEHVHVVNHSEENPDRNNYQFFPDEDDNLNSVFGPDSIDSSDDWMFDPAQSYLIGNIYHHNDDD